VNYPRRLGKYHILEKIGAGGMAEVYRARRIGEPAPARDYAIKQLSESLSRDPLLVSMFVDEARLASQLSHPSIVQLVEFGTDENGRVFMVMEFVDGRDLRWCLAMSARAQYWLPVEFSLTMARDLCRALGYAHRARGPDGKPLELVHRDVSHSNVFLSSRGETKLADFGIARAQGRQSKTRTGLVKGKLGYLSPEQVRAEKLDGRSDIFSATVVLWELLTQRRMFVGETEFKTMVAVCTEKRIPPSQFRPGLPKEIDKLVLDGVTINREDRYLTAEEMEDAIEQTARGLGLQLGHTIVAQVLRYLEDCAKAFAPEEAAKAALDDQRLSPEAALASIDKGNVLDTHTTTPTPHIEIADGGTGSFPVLTGELPSDSFAASWVDPDETVTDSSEEGGPQDNQVVDLLASRGSVSESPGAPPKPLPTASAREHTAEISTVEMPTFYQSIAGVQPLASFQELVAALDPRRRGLDDTVSTDRQQWVPVERFALLSGLEFATTLKDVTDPVASSPFSGPQLVSVLGDLALNGFTGRLIVDRGTVRYGMLLEAGGIVGLVSNRPAHQLLAVLTAAQLIPDNTGLTRAIHEVIQRDQTLDEVLESSFGIPREHIESFRHAAAHDVMKDLLALGDAHFAYERSDGWPGRQFMAGTALELMIPSTAQAWQDQELQAIIDSYGDRKLAVMPGFPLVARMLRLKQEAAPILREIQPGRSMGELIARFPERSELQSLARRLSVIFVETGALSIS